MQRIRDISKWLIVHAGSKLEFPNEKPRHVRIEVNAPTEARIDYIAPDGEVKFLALVKGRDTVEFETEGAFALTCDAEELYVYSAEAEIVHSTIEAPESFTRIMQGRRVRNPELEALMHQMNRNFERQLEKQARIYGSIIERGAHPVAQVAPSSSVPARVEGEPTPDGDRGPSDQAPSGTDDGDKEPEPAAKRK